MKKYIFLLFAGIAGLVSCGDDDKPSLPELNKLTKITCYKNGSTTPEFVKEITYNSDGEISYIIENNTDKKQFLYSGNTIVVAATNAADATSTEYILSGKTIVKKKVSDKNPYKNEIYVRDEYDYGYNRSALVQTSWIATSPTIDGKYETRTYKDAEKYTWQDDNVVRFTEDKSEMVYEYGNNNLRPHNFPFRVIASFAPVGMDVVTPLNLAYGAQNRNLPTYAYWYNFPDTNTKCAEYTYNFSSMGDYITGMTIQEKIYAINGTPGADNTYTYSFEYAN
ncbi:MULTISPECIES: DUF5032 domain-containing protein [Parabacteroides]|uniref:DUF4595 domain-containing protein n=1 Tax=Parabacteroides chinchillae TaxID=871327 RepID=A0A8G2FC53_9BACT|nr:MULTISPECIES: DUF5032 domain-containing protein [Parabacteroides]SEG23949.1 protein of unknown function [Parabacteroides chinchillae]